MSDICEEADWSSPSTFVRFYNLDVPALQATVLSAYGAFPLHGMVRYGSARLVTVRLSSGRFAFPLQFSTAIDSFIGLTRPDRR